MHSTKALLLILLLLLSLSSIGQEVFSKLEINNKASKIEYLSEFNLDVNYVVLKNVPSIKNGRVFDAFVNDDIIAITYSSNEKSTFADQLAIFNTQGVIKKNIVYCNQFSINEKQQRIYYLSSNRDKLFILNYEGHVLDSILFDSKVENFELFNDRIYFETKEVQPNGDKLYSLKLLSPKNKGISTIQKFTEPSMSMGRDITISSLSDLWCANYLFWANGVGNHVYRIDQYNNVQKIEIIFPSGRSYMDQVLTRYGTMDTYFFCGLHMNFKSAMYYYNPAENIHKISTIKIKDDIYETGEFNFKSSLNNQLFFTKKGDALSKQLKTKFNVSNNDILLIYSK